jgi:hypothetical protein
MPPKVARCSRSKLSMALIRQMALTRVFAVSRGGTNPDVVRKPKEAAGLAASHASTQPQRPADPA